MKLWTKDFHFDAAHKLPNYQGECAKLHGHTWTVKLMIEGSSGPGQMIIDFKILKHIIEGTLEKYDHVYLNDFIYMPTVENLVKKLCVPFYRAFLQYENVTAFEIFIQEGKGGWASQKVDLLKEEPIDADAEVEDAKTDPA